MANFSNFPARLKMALELKGYKTQKETADFLGVSEGYLSELLKGKKTPSSMLINLIESKMGIASAWLLYEQGPMMKTFYIAETEGGEIFQISVKAEIVQHNKPIIEKMMQQLTRIINEGDYVKTSALQGFLEAMDPERKKKEG